MKLAMPLGALVALVVAAPALAQDATGRFATTTLDLTGHGEAHAPPDKATIELGVASTAATPGQASERQRFGDDQGRCGAESRRDRRAGTSPPPTSSLQPQYAYAQGQPARLTGYQAVNQVRITVEDLTRLGPTLDSVVGAGATNVGAISAFGLKSRASAENFARLATVKALDDKAALYADAAGYHIRRLVNLTEASAEQALPMRSFALQVIAPVSHPGSLARPSPSKPGEIVHHRRRYWRVRTRPLTRWRPSIAIAFNGLSRERSRASPPASSPLCAAAASCGCAELRGRRWLARIKRLADHARRFQPVQFAVRQAQDSRQHLAAGLAESRSRGADRVGTAVLAEHRRGLLEPFHVRPFHLLPVSARRQVRLVEQHLGQPARGAGSRTHCLQRLHRRVRRALAVVQAAIAAFQLVLLGAAMAPAARRAAGSAARSGAFDGLGE